MSSIKKFFKRAQSFILKIQAPAFLIAFFSKIQKFISKKYKWIAAFLIAGALADLSLLFIWPPLLPEAAPPAGSRRKIFKARRMTPIASTNYIQSSNIFHRGPIPKTFKQDSAANSAAAAGASTPTALPLTLLGTIESSRPEFSMASILSKIQKKADSYFVGDIIDGKAQIKAIERRKVIFLNLASSRMEHIEIPIDENMLSISASTNTAPEKETKIPVKKPPYQGIDQVGKNEYSLSRSTVNTHIKQLPDILQQARVRPKYSVDGQILGHTFTWIKQGSVFEGLGFQKGDTLISVNGEKVQNNEEAGNLFKKLRASSQFEVVLESEDGGLRRLSYEINENESVQ